MYLHLVALCTIYVLPRFIRGERKAPSAKAATNGVAPQLPAPCIDSPANGIKANGLNGCQQQVQSQITPNENGFLDAEPHTTDKNHCDIIVADNRKGLLANGGDQQNGLPLANGSTHIETSDNLSTAATATAAPPPANGTESQQPHDYRHGKSADNHLSLKIRERIDSETRNIEEFIDKTVTGIVELKDDLMRVNDDEMYVNAAKYEMGNGHAAGTDDGLRRRNLTDLTNGKEIEAFLRKEINSVNVAGVLSNGHVD